MDSNFISNKKGAMEMSMGTIVTIILLVSVLVLGIVLVQNIFKSASGAVDLTDRQLKDQMSKLFSGKSDQKFIIIPETRIIEIKKGEGDQFAFSIRNLDSSVSEHTFSYEVSADSIAECAMDKERVNGFIGLGKSGTQTLGSGSLSDEPVRVGITVPESATLCQIRYKISIKLEDGSTYAEPSVDVHIVS